MRTLLVLPAIAIALGCESGSKQGKGTSGGPGAPNLDELRERALAAIRGADTEAYLDLVAAPAFFMKHCPEEQEYARLEEGGAGFARDQQRDAVRRALELCTEIDWSRAEMDRIEGGEPKKKLSKLTCREAVVEFDDLTAYFRIGEDTWRVKVANEIHRIAGRYVVVKPPSCERHDG